MIVRDAPRALDLIFAIRGSILPRIALRLIALMGFAALLVWLDRRADLLPETGGLGFTVFGIALSLFLGFRNNAAYDRWWEARKLWGGLLADMRSLAREAEVFVRDDALRLSLLRTARGFLHLHRANLRGLGGDELAQRHGGTLTDAPHPPDAALDAMAALVKQGALGGMIDSFGQRTLAERLRSMALKQAGCERIATTPLPYVYSLLIYRTTWLFCLLLPLALVGPAGWLTPVFVGIVGYVFFGLAEVTEELSHPFGQTPNGLPLDAICRAAEISLAPHLDEEAPAPLEPKDYFLS
ncbi:bestrophin family protein [Alteraurantiacibacter palmitatis]|uniref:Bestrophin family protein n=1 Tax=Alteraurantiacibacter palmitatis TaxID=2054628 RepID=A0ABV7E3Z9_9SPHN